MALFIFSENVFLKKRGKQIMDESLLNDYGNDEDSRGDDEIIKRSQIVNSVIEDSVYWKVWSFGLFHVSMMAALSIVKNKAMIVNLDNCCNTVAFLVGDLDVKI